MLCQTKRNFGKSLGKITSNLIMKKDWSYWIIILSINVVFAQQRKNDVSGFADFFFLNKEYSNLIADGYTWAGFQGEAKYNHSITGKWRIMAGLHLQQLWGHNAIIRFKPLFTLNYTSSSHQFFMGFLDQSVRKKLWQPLYDPEHIYHFDKTETGLQYLYNSPSTEGEIWLNWNRFIHFKDTVRENINFGTRWNRTIISLHKIKIKWLIQMIIHHRGGQINLKGKYLTGKNNILSVLSVGTGPEFIYKKDSLSEWVVFIRGLMHTMNSDNPEELKFKKGYAIWMGSEWYSSNFHVGLEWWFADQFNSPWGEDIYMTASRRVDKYFDDNGEKLEIFSNYTEPQRMLFINRLGYYKNITHQFLFQIGTEIFYQINRGEIPGYDFIRPVENHWDVKMYIKMRYDF